MAVSVFGVLRKKKNREGKYPLSVRVTKDRSSSYYGLGHYITTEQWNNEKAVVKKSHPNAKRLNELIARKIAEIRDIAMKLEVEKPLISAREIVALYQGTTTKVGFYTFAQTYLTNLDKSGQYTRYTAEKSRVKYFKDFCNGKEIAFEEITVSKLRSFASYLKTKKNVGDRTIMNHYVVIRTIFNLAIADGLVKKDFYPFGRGKIVIKFPDSIKIGLTQEELALFEKVPIPFDTAAWHAKNLWLLSFYFAGMRASDIIQLRWREINNDRLYYQMDKNKKTGSIKIAEKAVQIIALYESRKLNKERYVFPFLDLVNDFDPKDKRRKISNAIGLCNKHLKRIAQDVGIEKPLTMHIARHTFGNLSGNKVPIQMLQKLYRHSSITTTIGYQANFIFKDTDDALDSVVNF